MIPSAILLKESLRTMTGTMLTQEQRNLLLQGEREIDECLEKKRMFDTNMLHEGDVVVFMITGNIPQYRGVVKAVKGYQNRPEVEVTHIRYTIDGKWIPETWPMILKGDDMIIQERG